VPNEKMNKCYKMPMSNEKMHRYLNTTYIVLILCFKYNIEWQGKP